MTYSTFDGNNIALVENYVRNIRGSVATDDQLIPTISYWALQKSISNLQAFANFYFPLHEVSEADIPRFMPLFIFLEATIYQIDEEYENQIGNPQFTSKHIFVLRNVLNQLNLFDEKIEKEIQEGLTYYSLEQSFCSGAMPTEESLDQASLFKCYDFGILQRVLLRLIDQPYEEELLSICQRAAQIDKICSDIEDYQKDVESNVINIYRMFVRLYGTEAPQKLRNFIAALNSKFQQEVEELKKNNPAGAEKFVYLNNKFMKQHLQLLSSNIDTIDGLVIPEIPEPILE